MEGSDFVGEDWKHRKTRIWKFIYDGEGKYKRAPPYLVALTKAIERVPSNTVWKYLGGGKGVST